MRICIERREERLFDVRVRLGPLSDKAGLRDLELEGFECRV